MKNADSDIYLYAKGWYRRTNVIKDLTTIMRKRSGCLSISISAIFDVVYAIAWPLIKNGTYDMRDVLSFCFRGKSVFKQKKAITIKNIIAGLLVPIQLVKVQDNKGNSIIKLDAPDYRLLPPPIGSTVKEHLEMWEKQHKKDKNNKLKG